MQVDSRTGIESQSPRPPRLRAMVEIVDGELKIYPIAETDEQAEQITRTLLLWGRHGA